MFSNSGILTNFHLSQGNPYSSLPYATYRRPAPGAPQGYPPGHQRPPGPPAFHPGSGDYSLHFQTFGRHECFSQPCSMSRPDLLMAQQSWDARTVPNVQVKKLFLCLFFSNLLFLDWPILSWPGDFLYLIPAAAKSANCGDTGLTQQREAGRDALLIASQRLHHWSPGGYRHIRRHLKAWIHGGKCCTTCQVCYTRQAGKATSHVSCKR